MKKSTILIIVMGVIMVSLLVYTVRQCSSINNKPASVEEAIVGDL